jgi:hypothetical protein
MSDLMRRLMPPDPNYPMTPAQVEASRRAIADARFREGAPVAANMAAEATGIPMAYRGGEDVYYGVMDGNPMQVARGAAGVGFGLMPWSRVGRALMMSRPVTTTGGSLMLPNMDASMPEANAAGAQMPPLPVSRQAAYAPPPAPVEPAPAPAPEAPAEPPGLLGTFINQASRNISDAAGAAGDYIQSAGQRLSGLMGGADQYTPMSKEDWIEKNAASDVAAMEKARERGSKNVDDVGAAEGRRVRDENRKLARELQQKIDAGYQSYVQGLQEAQRKDLYEKDFAQRNPELAAAYTFGPMLLAGGRYRGVVSRRNKDIRKLTNQKYLTPEDQNVLASLTQKGDPSTLPYTVAGGFAGSALGKAGMDYYDATALPSDSPVRQRVKEMYPPRNVEDALNLASSYGIRGAGAAAAPHAFKLLARGLPESTAIRALERAGVPNVEAARMRSEGRIGMATVDRDERQAMRGLMDQDPPQQQQQQSSGRHAPVG